MAKPLFDDDLTRLIASAATARGMTDLRDRGGAAEVARATGLSETHVYHHVKRGIVPAPEQREAYSAGLWIPLAEVERAAAVRDGYRI